ncbi:hypothetical protein KSP39_PZI004386 [Platanthera zijinensis]|uniref:Uncharacterized protein n=1 Tax=Platanthera zijinensis TaxID=2320716 RepID=A0AAP0GCS7_9ASPA
MGSLFKASTSDNNIHNFQGEAHNIPFATRGSYYDIPGQRHYGQQMGSGQSSTAPWAAHWVAHPQIFGTPPTNILGQPSSFGVAWSHAAVAPSSYSTTTPSFYGAATPSFYGASTPSSYASTVAQGYNNTASAHGSYGATVAPSSYGVTVVPSSYGATAAPSLYGAIIAPSACAVTVALPNTILLQKPNTSIGDAHSKKIKEDMHKIIDDIDTRQWTQRIAANLKMLDDLIICIDEEEQEAIQTNNLLDTPITVNIVSSPMEVLSLEVLSFAPVVIDIPDNMALPPLEELMQHHPNSNVIMGSLAHVTQVGRPHDDTFVRSHVSNWTIHVFNPGGGTVSIQSAQVEPPINKL